MTACKLAVNLVRTLIEVNRDQSQPCSVADQAKDL